MKRAMTTALVSAAAPICEPSGVTSCQAFLATIFRRFAFNCATYPVGDARTRTAFAPCNTLFTVLSP